MHEDLPNSESLNDEQIESLKEIFVTQLFPIIDQAQYNSAANVSTVLLQIANQLECWDCIGFERVFRETKSRVFLLANPEIPEGAIPINPLSKDTTEFSLYVCMNGENEAKNTLASWGISETENSHNLSKAGILTVVQMERLQNDPDFEEIQADNEHLDRYFNSGGRQNTTGNN